MPANGQRLVYWGTRFDTGMVEYTCDEGHILVGTANQTCESNGMWSANVPLCNRKLKLIRATLSLARTTNLYMLVSI